MLLTAAHVLPVDGPPLSPGWVEIDGATVRATGAGPRRGADLALPGHVLLPGLINAHCHLDYTLFHGLLTPGRGFTDWIAQINELKRSHTMDDFRGAVGDGLAQLIDNGTTSVVNIEAWPAMVRHTPIRCWWAIEGIDVGGPFTWPELTDPPALSPHAPFTASPALYRSAKEIATRTGALFTTHVGESTDEHAMFFKADGPLHDFLARLGRDMTDCGHGTSLGCLLDEHLLPDRSLLAHVNHFTSSDLARSAAAGHAVVHCPQTHRYFGRRPFDWPRIRQAGLPVFLGTDSLASSASLSLFDEMRAFLDAQPAATPDIALRMVTADPGEFLMPGTGLGTLRPGAPADLIAVPARRSEPLTAVTAHRGRVPLVIARGAVLRNTVA